MLKNSIYNNQLNTSISLLMHPNAYIESLLGYEGAKTCLGMAEYLNISHDVLQKILNSGAKTADELREILHAMVRDCAKNSKHSFLINDDTRIVKEFSKILDDLGLVNESNVYDKQKHYKIVVMVWTNDKITIPVDFKIWIAHEQKSKVKLAQEMVIENYKKIPFDVVLMDGLYASKEMFTLLDNLSLKFIMRLPKSRKIQNSAQELNAPIGDHWQYKLQKNSHIKRFTGYIQGKLRYIVVQKQKNKHGIWKTRYLISNMDESAHNISAIYEYRWTIEEFFRTAKQKLGIQDCQSRTIQAQKNHIWLVFAAFASADLIKLYNNLENTDEAIRFIRRQNQSNLNLNISGERIFYALA